MKEPKPEAIPLSDLVIRGMRSAHGGALKPKVLCLHGWLDNANSFYPLLPLLPQFDCVAIDLPGHGKSGHFQHTVPYTIASAAHYVLRAADALGWDEFHIVGHSLGGCIAPVCALADPKRIRSLSLIDALGPVTEPANALPDRLRRFHHEMKMRDKTGSRVFNHISEAVNSRLKAATMKRTSAELIVERQLEKTPRGLVWSFDSKLRAASPGYYTEEQVQSILSAISCPTVCVVASDGNLANYRHLDKRKSCVASLSWVELPGNHHLHLDDPQPVADVINKFLSAQTQ